MAKRLGIGKYGHVDSLGPVKIGSIFSTMQHLPEIELTDSDLSLAKFQGAIGKSGDIKQGLYLSSEGDVLIDNLQGVVTLHTAKRINIQLHTVESAKLIINAPNAHVSLNLKSIHDLSHIHCASAEILISDSFDKCLIFNQKEGVPLNEPGTDQPVLKVLAEEKLDLQILSDFEILKRQITSKMEARRAR